MVLTFFTGAYAISDKARNDQPPVLAASFTKAGTMAGAFPDDTEVSDSSAQDWYEKAAIWVCPLH